MGRHVSDTGFESYLLAYARLDEADAATVVATASAGHLTIAVSGCVDVQACSTVTQRLCELIGGSDHRHVVLDLSGVEFCDCAGVRALLAVQEQATGAGVTCTVQGVRPHVRWLLEFTGAAPMLGLTRPG
ncbi:STAS domain-containing protein [Actinoplanes aureus]|uniref:STAS domain-containing protein n=1 Tax=Actinoplanes aureus TaxID=2792083 RepID=A0A931G4L8_9ACTN|nr:STAS domain-containing protein [Actinoplanes aureus]MBG0565409.1 STAS domain-containing protein [Actinoplanes aureus]